MGWGNIPMQSPNLVYNVYFHTEILLGGLHAQPKNASLMNKQFC